LAIQVGAKVAVTAGSAAKLRRCRELGAEITVNYREQDFVTAVRGATGGHGADVVLDNMGASYLSRNIDVLATNGRLVVIGMQGGTRAELDLGRLMARRAAVISTSLRARPAEEKAAIVDSVCQHVWPLLSSGAVRPVIHERLPLAEAAQGHRLMAESSHIGKILLTI
jgi:NADPH:quinone reductase-like Zn-dependent oxidoreductase